MSEIAATTNGEWQLLDDGGSETPWIPRRKHCSVAFDGQVFIIGGFEGVSNGMNDVWSYDVNRQSWKCVNEDAGWSGRDGHVAIVFNGSLFVIGGTNDPYSCKADVWQSEDGGVRWRELCAFAPWKERWQHSAVVHEDRIFILGGWGGYFMNDVWSSPDGLHWIQETSSAEWQPRMFHCAVSFNGFIYVIGGSDGKKLMNDVWASSDRGRSWTLVCENAAWEGRQGHACAVVEKEVYLMGGMVDGDSRRNDTWKSDDNCLSWVQVRGSAAWSPRQGHAAAVCDGAIYLSGGWNEGYLNDFFGLRVSPSQRVASLSGALPSAVTTGTASAAGANSPVSGDGLLSGLSTTMDDIAQWHRLRRVKSRIVFCMHEVCVCVEEACSLSPEETETGTETGESSSETEASTLESLAETEFYDIYREILRNFDVQVDQTDGERSGEGERDGGVTSSPSQARGQTHSLPISTIATTLTPTPTQSPPETNYSVLRSAQQMQDSSRGLPDDDPGRIFFSDFSVGAEYSPLRVVHKLRSVGGSGSVKGRAWGTASAADMDRELDSRSLSLQQLDGAGMESPRGTPAGNSNNTSSAEVGVSESPRSTSGGVSSTTPASPLTTSPLSPSGGTGMGQTVDLHAELSQDISRVRRIQKAIRMRAESAVDNAAAYTYEGEAEEADSSSLSSEMLLQRSSSGAPSALADMPEAEEIQNLMDKRAVLASKSFWRALVILRHILLQKQMKKARLSRLAGAEGRLRTLRDGWADLRKGSPSAQGKEEVDLEKKNRERNSGDVAVALAMGDQEEEESNVRGTPLIMGVSGVDWASEWRHVSAQVKSEAGARGAAEVEEGVESAVSNKEEEEEKNEEDDDEMRVEGTLRELQAVVGGLGSQLSQLASWIGQDCSLPAPPPSTSSSSSSPSPSSSSSSSAAAAAAAAAVAPPTPTRGNFASTAPGGEGNLGSGGKEINDSAGDGTSSVSSFLQEAQLRLREPHRRAAEEMQSKGRVLRRRVAALMALAEALLRTAKGYVEHVTAVMRADLTRFEELESEVRKWVRACVILAHVPSLKERCNALVDMTVQWEDDLVQLETIPIDKRAQLSKATLEARSVTRGVHNRRRFVGGGGSTGAGRSLTPASSGGTLASSTGEKESSNISPMGSVTGIGGGSSTSPTTSLDGSSVVSGACSSLPRSPSSADNEGYIRSLKLELSAAEADAKLARKAMRAWNRDSRKVALEYVPEMFLLLPDLLSPGSVLGDGGFGQLAGIPLRRLQDYDIDYISPVNPGSHQQGQGQEEEQVAGAGAGAGAGGETNQLRATYDGQQVVLKTFLMHDSDQRRCLERELSILGSLKNDAIVAPAAIVDGCSYEQDIEESLRKMAIYVEYPYFQGGDLSVWLQAQERKPWELQGVSRQVLYGVLYLHDHGVVHGGIKLTSIFMHEDGRLVIAGFDRAEQVVSTELGKDRRGGAVALVEQQLRESLSQNFPALATPLLSSASSTPLHHSPPSAPLSASITKPPSLSLATAGAGAGVSPPRPTRRGTEGYMAPEIERGDEEGGPRYESDMYSFGVLLYVMHFTRDPKLIIPGEPLIPVSADQELSGLIRRLMSLEPSSRLSAAQALLHPYFRRSFAERLQQEGEVVEQDRKLDAVRNMIQRARDENRINLERLTVSRDKCALQVLDYFKSIDLKNMRCHLRVRFENEAGVDEGGPLTEMFHLFFDQVLDPSFGLFHSCHASTSTSRTGISDGGALSGFQQNQDQDRRPHEPETGYYSPASAGAPAPAPAPGLHTSSGDVLDAELHASGVEIDPSSGLSSVMFDQAGEMKHVASVMLPDPADLSMDRLHSLRAFGRAMIKCMYEGRRMGTKLGSAVFKFLTDASPTIRDLQQFDPQSARSCEWALSTEGLKNFGLHFDSVGAPELGDVTDQNKVEFVKRKVQLTLIESRKVHLAAIKNGFIEGLNAVSPEAAPFMGLLSHTDWRIMLCGDQTISGPQVVSCLHFVDFHKRSQMPTWLKELLVSASEDHLRKFLVFLTGSPSLSSSTSSGEKMEISVRCQPRSEALPVAHTCFFQLDIPDYKDKETLQAKFVYAITHAQSFEVV